MKALSISSHTIMFVAVLICLAVVGSLPASAVPPTQVAIDRIGHSFTTLCCINLGPKVKVTEPTAITPVVVTWSTDYQAQDEFHVGLSVNEGPCVTYGPTVAPSFSVVGGSGFASMTYQWVVLPSDGLIRGTNTFEVCGGGVGTPVKFVMGINTLSVRIGK